MKLKSLQSILVGASVVSFTAFGAINLLPPQSGSMPELAEKEIAVASSESGVLNAPSVGITRGASVTPPKTMAELTSREYVLTFTSDRSGFGRSGEAVHFTQVANTDSVQISWFYYDNPWKGKVDFEKGEIVVPAQYYTTNEDHQVWFLPYDGKTWTTTGDVVFKFNEDGSMTPDKGWGFMWYDKTTTGYNWCKTAANTQLLVPNGTMECEKVETVENVSKNVKYTYPIVGSQKDNILTILNFADNGNYATFIVNSDATISVPKQLEIHTSNVDYYMAGNVSVDEKNNISWDWSYNAQSTTANGFKLGPWSLIGYHNTTGGLYWYGLYNYADIKLDFDINYKATPFEGNGTAKSPYLIKNAADLTKFIEYVNQNNIQGMSFKQTADINLGGMELTLPVISREFNNTYDGGNFSLKGLNLVSGTTEYAGLFATLGADGVLENLTLEGKATLNQKYSSPLIGKNYGTLNNITSKMEISAQAQYCGGLAVYSYAGAEFNNCVFAGTINMTTHYAAGLTAYCASTTFNKCGFTGKLLNAVDVNTTAINNVGGLVAYAYPSSFIECYSEGEFSADSLSTYRGGLVGYNYAGTSATANYGQVLFKKCVNKTNIKGKQYLGGLAGTIPIPAATSATTYKYRSNILMDSCVNYGDIYATTSGTTGGIAGTVNNPAVIKNCENYGSIKNFKGSYIGGILGQLSSTGANDSIRSVVINCRNYGEIGDIDLTDANNSYCCGGIIGFDASPYGTLQDCENYGDITSVYNGGGIAGGLSGNYNTITGCVNYGDVTNKTYSAGGITGYNTSATQDVTGNINFGAVQSVAMKPGTTASATSEFGPRIGGIIGYGYGTIADNLNVGDVTGPSLVGGIIGVTVKGTTEANFGCKVVRNLNAGKVLCRYTVDDKTVEATDSLGAIIGNSLLNKTQWVAEYNSQDSNYYTNNVLAHIKPTEDYLANHAGTEVSDADLINFNKLGAGWSCYDKYCYPIPVMFQNSDLAKVWAAQVVPATGDNLTKITQDFYVGAPKGLVWTSTSTNLTFNGSDAVWGKPATVGEVTLTATCGDFEKTIVIQVDKATSVEDLAVDASEVVAERWISTSGQRVAKPALKDGQVYILIRTYKSGQTETIKVLN